MCDLLRSQRRLHCCVWCGIVSTVSPLVYLCSSNRQIVHGFIYLCTAPQYVPIWDIPRAKASCGPLEMSHRALRLHYTSCYVTINGSEAWVALRCASVFYLFMTFYLACCICRWVCVFEKQYSHIFTRTVSLSNMISTAKL